MYIQMENAVLKKKEKEKKKEKKEEVSWYFTPSQPVRLYQGEKEKQERKKEFLFIKWVDKWPTALKGHEVSVIIFRSHNAHSIEFVACTESKPNIATPI